jgi:hypothetical protein
VGTLCGRSALLCVPLVDPSGARSPRRRDADTREPRVECRDELIQGFPVLGRATAVAHAIFELGERNDGYTFGWVQTTLGVSAEAVSLEGLERAKPAVGRLKDLLDLAEILEIRRRTGREARSFVILDS